ncbi:MAG: hypothetical protein MMC33_009156 [Icmadophila ericetorum]|nr:hypothetical protein [Icmadophila ericetorum]
MNPQRYEKIPGQEQEDSQNTTPNSPPPSFRSRASSLVSRHRNQPSHDSPAVDRTLADTFDTGDGSDDDDAPDDDDRQRLIRSPTASTIDPRSDVSERPDGLQRRITELPTNSATTRYNSINRNRPTGASTVTFSSSNDGVFANLDAKPERGEKLEEQPPSYEQAAADATPPYWETTIMAPGMASDEVYIDGLPVGSLFSFVWNGLISMSFQLVGFLLTYLLHTTHAAKNGSRAGLGINLVQYGFYMKRSTPVGQDTSDPVYQEPSDPNSHDFDPSEISTSVSAKVAELANSQPTNGNVAHRTVFPATEWLAYLLMIAGWFILIRAVTDYIKARRHEQLVLQSPDRGLGVPIIAEGEQTETVV